MRETKIYDRVCVLVFRTNLDGVGVMDLERYNVFHSVNWETNIPKARVSSCREGGKGQIS